MSFGISPRLTWMTGLELSEAMPALVDLAVDELHLLDIGRVHLARDDIHLWGQRNSGANGGGDLLCSALEGLRRNLTALRVEGVECRLFSCNGIVASG